ncbi:hypothetical protein DPMN_160993 [Dreissena polymorpha]|uniref:Uncharacterized protein n=1 Tax=Dreissena polymorpha TaxID=45954 RepID=A0A9D4IQP0_DREPO|nr:hypothetical protein DPMN_160993 [Dreissena polymorpha]
MLEVLVCTLKSCVMGNATVMTAGTKKTAPPPHLLMCAAVSGTSRSYAEGPRAQRVRGRVTAAHTSRVRTLGHVVALTRRPPPPPSLRQPRRHRTADGEHGRPGRAVHGRAAPGRRHGTGFVTSHHRVPAAPCVPVTPLVPDLADSQTVPMACLTGPRGRPGATVTSRAARENAREPEHVTAPPQGQGTLVVKVTPLRRCCVWSDPACARST